MENKNRLIYCVVILSCLLSLALLNRSLYNKQEEAKIEQELIIEQSEIQEVEEKTEEIKEEKTDSIETQKEDKKESEEKKEEVQNEENKESEEANTEKTETSNKKENSLKDLKKLIQQYIEENNIDPSLISYNIMDLETNESIGSKNKSENFTAGSVYKLPLSMIYYDKLAKGEVSKYTTYKYSESDKEYGGGYIESRYGVGEAVPLYDVLYGALVYSDNMPGHIMFNNLGGWTQFKKIAAKYSDKKQNDEFYSLANVLNAEYMTDVMKQIYDHQDKYAQVIEYLRIAAPYEFLNNTMQVNMVQKVGFYLDAMNACGLSLDGHPYIFCLFTQLGEDYGMIVEGDLNAICYEYFNEKTK